MSSQLASTLMIDSAYYSFTLFCWNIETRNLSISTAVLGCRCFCNADRGLMSVTAHPAGGYKPMLPLDTKFKDCRGDNRTIYCFKAGKSPTYNDG